MELGNVRHVKGVFVRRLIAGVVDSFTGFVLALLLSRTVGVFFAKRAVVTLHIGSEGTVWKGPIPLILGVLGTVVYVLPLSCLVVFLAEPLTGVTPGKLLLRIRVTTLEGAPPTSTDLWQRTLIKTTGLWGLVLGFLLGSWQVALVAAGCGIAVLIGFAGNALPRLPSLHDRLARTDVTRF